MALPPPVGRVLRASVARPELGLSFPSAVAALPPEQHEELARAAVYHGIAGYVRRAAREHATALGAGAVLDAAVEGAAMRHLRTLADLRAVRAALDGVTGWLVIKGPVLAHLLHGGPELRPYSDLDLLVPPRRFGQALAALEAAGGVVRDRNWTLIGREMKGEVHVVLPLGTVADVHWSLFNERTDREAFAAPAPALLERSRQVRVGDLTVDTLDEADTVVHLALHGMLSGGHRLTWLKDLERALDVLGVPPAEVDARADEWRAGLALASAVARTRAALGCPPLAPRRHGPGARAWLALGRAVWRLAPAERQDGYGSAARMVARSARPTAAASARLLAAKTGAFALGERRRAGRIDPGDPGSDRFDAGGEAARRAYLDAVARQDT